MRTRTIAMTLKDLIGEGDAIESDGAIWLSIEGIESKSRDQCRFSERWGIGGYESVSSSGMIDATTTAFYTAATTTGLTQHPKVPSRQGHLHTTRLRVVVEHCVGK
jgi:hypothetical protein